MEPRLQVEQKVEMATVNGHSVLGDDDVLEAIFNPEAPTGGKFIRRIFVSTTVLCVYLPFTTNSRGSFVRRKHETDEEATSDEFTLAVNTVLYCFI